MLTILYHKIRGFSRLHIVFKDGKVITGFAPVLLPITTWRLWNQPTMRYPSVRKQRFHRLGNEASGPPVTLAKIAMMLRANAGRSILPQNTIPSPRPGLPGVQLFPLPNTQPTPRITRRATVPSAKHLAHAPDYPLCNRFLTARTRSPLPGLPVAQLFPLPNTQPTPRLTCRATVSSARTRNPRPGLPGVQLFPLPNTQPTPRITRCATVSSARTPNCRRRVVSDQRRPSPRVRCCRSPRRGCLGVPAPSMRKPTVVYWAQC